MPSAQHRPSSTPDVMQTEDRIDTLIKQTIVKDPFLSLSRAHENNVQWIQLLNALDSHDVNNSFSEFPGWPFLSPMKVQLQKCDKCSREFCSPINYRRHIRVHHRLKKLDKDFTETRDLLGAYWDKLSVEEAKEVVSFENVALEEVPGSSILKSLTTLIQNQGIYSFPPYYLMAGAALLDIVQSKSSSFPISSQELFSVLDDASEKTCLCGTAESVQRYVFDGEAGKVGLEPKNLVACTSFLLEQNLVKAWLTDKDAEALRCQKQLVEEEEAAQKRQAEILERKRQKKLRHKEQKAREQRCKAEADIEGDTDSTVKALSLGEASLDTLNFEAHNTNTFSDNAASPLPLQYPDTNEEINEDTHSEEAEILERTRQKKFRQKGQKAREQRRKAKAEIEGNIDRTVTALSLEVASLDMYNFEAHNKNTNTFSDNAASPVPLQYPETNEEIYEDNSEQAEILERKCQKKFRQKGQKAREQRRKAEAEIEGNIDSTVKALSVEEASLDTYKFEAHNTDRNTFSDNAASPVPLQYPETNVEINEDNSEQAEILERKCQKFRQKGQKAREQRCKAEAEIEGNIDSTVKALSVEEASLDTYKFEAHNTDRNTFSDNAASPVPLQYPETNEEINEDNSEQAEILERKRQKKFRQKGQKASEQRRKAEAEIEGNIGSTVKALSVEEASLDTYKFEAHNTDRNTFSDNAASPLPLQYSETNVEINEDNSEQAEILKRKRQKKCRLKRQKAREQRLKSEAEIKGDIDSTVKASLEEASLDTYNFEAHNTNINTFSDNAASLLNLQYPDTNEEINEDTRSEFDIVTDQNLERRRSALGPINHCLAVSRQQGLPKSQWAVVNDLHTNQNSPFTKFEVNQKYGAHRDKKASSGSKVWSRKSKTEIDEVVLKSTQEKEPDKVKNQEVLIGSISLNLANCRQSEGNMVASQKDSMVENVGKHHSTQDRPMKTDLVTSGNNRSTVKLWRPVSRFETQDPLPVQSGGTEADAVHENEQNWSGPSCSRVDSRDGGDIDFEKHFSHVEGRADPGSFPFSIQAAKAFLQQRWKEAISSEHVTLPVTSDSESSGCQETQDSKTAACQSSDVDRCNIVANADNKLPAATRVAKFKPRLKNSEKGIKIKYVPKQKTYT